MNDYSHEEDFLHMVLNYFKSTGDGCATGGPSTGRMALYSHRLAAIAYLELTKIVL